ncbi:MAG: glycosyltransferase family 9 protein [Planctomycetota bacterium]
MRILICRLSALGDIVQATGVVRELAERQPDAEVHWVVQSGFRTVLDGLPGLAEIVEHDRHGGPLAFLRTIRRLRRNRYDVAMDFQGNWKSAALARFSGASRVIGASRRDRRESESSILVRETVSLGPGLPQHPAIVAWQLAKVLDPELSFRAPSLQIDESDRQSEEEAVRALGLDPAKPITVLIDAPRDDPRRLSPGALTRAAENSAQVILLRGPDEGGQPAPLGVCVLEHPSGSLRRLMALGAILARNDGHAVGPDKGASHVFAAMGARTTVFFGPTDPSRTGPPNARALVAPEPPECAPCNRTTCVEPAGNLCMAFFQREAVERHRPEGWTDPPEC